MPPTPREIETQATIQTRPDRSNSAGHRKPMGAHAAKETKEGTQPAITHRPIPTEPHSFGNLKAQKSIFDQNTLYGAKMVQDSESEVNLQLQRTEPAGQSFSRKFLKN